MGLGSLGLFTREYKPGPMKEVQPRNATDSPQQSHDLQHHEHLADLAPRACTTMTRRVQTRASAALPVSARARREPDQTGEFDTYPEP